MLRTPQVSKDICEVWTGQKVEYDAVARYEIVHKFGAAKLYITKDTHILVSEVI